MLKLNIAESGPIFIEVKRAVLRIGSQEQIINKKIIALCRCGESSKKPFCDGSHKSCEFSGDMCVIEIE
jgi:CDGSH-type Zn-finger protein